jgi:two-component system, OmpR family, alkaline phosphatase synthesis response regulator PhoP
MHIYIFHKGKNSFVDHYLASEENAVLKTPYNERVVEKLATWSGDVIIIDGVGGCGNSADVQRVVQIRSATDIPIFLVLGSRDDSSYREQMFNAGVDGCIQVPFMKEELNARLKILVHKKREPLFTGTIISRGDVHMNIHTHEVHIDGERLDLTKIEYGILFHLFLHRHAVVKIEELHRYLHQEAKNTSSVLNVHILNIRKKLGRRKIIETIPQFGFRAI